MEEQQAQIDYVRGEQLGAIRNCDLPSVRCRSGKTVSGRAMKTLLLAIDSRAGKEGSCWASLDRLEIDTGLNRKTVQRAIEGLRKLSLLVEWDDEHDSRKIHRRIAFTNLEDFRSQKIRDTRNPDDRSATRGTGNQIRDTGSEIRDTGNQIRDTRNPLRDHEGNTKGTQRSMRGGNGVLKMAEGGSATLQRDLETSQLIDPETIETLWVKVIERGVLPNTSYWRETFYGLCWSIWRNREAFRNPIGILHSKLRGGTAAVQSQVTDEPDRREARRLMQQLDREFLEEPPEPAEEDPQMRGLREFEARRQEWRQHCQALEGQA